MKKITSMIIALAFLFNASSAYAVYDPKATANNIFGIHIADENDIPAVSDLVNKGDEKSADWGYVTVVIPANDKNHDKWAGIFKKLRDYHLVPIVRIASKPEGAVWAVPKEEEAKEWAEFLDTLPWPIINRYVILFNEVNHNQEYGGKSDPRSYAKVAKAYAIALKEKNSEFFLLPAGMDLYAPNGSTTMDAVTFWEGMEAEVPGILKLFDGWSSHSYPSGDFSGSPYETGRKSIQGYKWELDYLSSRFGVDKNLPVFITETGWAQNPRLSREQIAEYYEIAFRDIWSSDPQVVAVTPFLLNYQDGLFSKFSWKKLGEDAYHPQYASVQELPKVSGNPITVPGSSFGKLLTSTRERLLSSIPSNILGAQSSKQ